MSNKKAKQARQAKRLAQSNVTEKNYFPNWDYKSWADYTDSERIELKSAGVKNEEDYLRLLRDGVRSEETRDFYTWAIHYGVGFFSNQTEFIQAMAWRLGSIERDVTRKASSRGPATGDLSRMKSVYQWNLKRGDKYVASPYSFYTPAGRAWLVRFLLDAGVTNLIVDTVETGNFDINDTIMIDLRLAA